MIIPEMYAHSSPCPFSIDGGPENMRCTCGLDDLLEELSNYELDYRDPELRVYRAAPEMLKALERCVNSLREIEGNVGAIDNDWPPGSDFYGIEQGEKTIAKAKPLRHGEKE